MALRSRCHHVQWAISDDGGSRVAAMSKLLSEYVREHIYLTFQADCVAFKIVDHVNWRRLCWASDFPHSDSTWP
jgi:hypothetical protein